MHKIIIILNTDTKRKSKMKFTYAAWVIALLAFTSSIDNFAMAQEDKVEEPAAEGDAAEGDAAGTEEPVADEADAPAEEAAEEPEVVEEEEEEAEETTIDETANKEPEGPVLTSDYYVLEQAAFNWEGFPVRTPYITNQVKAAKKNFDSLKDKDIARVEADDDAELKTITEL